MVPVQTAFHRVRRQHPSASAVIEPRLGKISPYYRVEAVAGKTQTLLQPRSHFLPRLQVTPYVALRVLQEISLSIRRQQKTSINIRLEVCLSRHPFRSLGHCPAQSCIPMPKDIADVSRPGFIRHQLVSGRPQKIRHILHLSCADAVPGSKFPDILYAHPEGIVSICRLLPAFQIPACCHHAGCVICILPDKAAVPAFFRQVSASVIHKTVYCPVFRHRRELVQLVILICSLLDAVQALCRPVS